MKTKIKHLASIFFFLFALITVLLAFNPSYLPPQVIVAMANAKLTLSKSLDAIHHLIH